MKKLILIVFIFIGLGAHAQFNILADTIRVEKVQLMGSTQLKELGTATDSCDAVPWWQISDSIDGNVPDSVYFKVDATNISQVEFVIGKDTLKESFSHQHLEYALMTQMLRANDSIDSLRVAINRNNVFEKELTDAEVSIAVGFNISSKSLVFLNGGILQNTQWSGAGTETIILTLDTKQYDNFLIKQQ